MWEVGGIKIERTRARNIFLCVCTQNGKKVFFFLVKRSVPENFPRENFSGPVHLQIVFAYFECLTSIVCQVLQVAPPERRPLPGQAQVYTGFHLKDRFPFCVWVIIILMRRNVVSQCLLYSTLFPCVVFTVVMMKNIVLYWVVMWTPSLAWPSSLCDEDECNAVDYTDDHVQSVPNKSTFQKLIFNWTKV